MAQSPAKRPGNGARAAVPVLSLSFSRRKGSAATPASPKHVQKAKQREAEASCLSSLVADLCPNASSSTILFFGPSPLSEADLHTSSSAPGHLSRPYGTIVSCIARNKEKAEECRRIRPRTGSSHGTGGKITTRVASAVRSLLIATSHHRARFQISQAIISTLPDYHPQSKHLNK